MYNYNTAYGLFALVGTTTILGAQWNADVLTATAIYIPQNGTMTYNLGSQTQAAKVDTSLTVRFPQSKYSYDSQ